MGSVLEYLENTWNDTLAYRVRSALRLSQCSTLCFGDSERGWHFYNS